MLAMYLTIDAEFFTTKTAFPRFLSNDDKFKVLLKELKDKYACLTIVNKDFQRYTRILQSDLVNHSGNVYIPKLIPPSNPDSKAKPFDQFDIEQLRETFIFGLTENDDNTGIYSTYYETAELIETLEIGTTNETERYNYDRLNALLLIL